MGKQILMTSGDAKCSSTHTSLPSAISASASSSKTFLIGGAQLYNLSLTSSPPLINRMLLTRVESADGSDIACDTFLEDFTTHTDEYGKETWALASHKELEEYVGFEVQEGDIEEKGFRYRFEMWVRI
jgi:dihydrofolate reductase